jgi:hypothetical protein
VSEAAEELGKERHWRAEEEEADDTNHNERRYQRRREHKYL